MRKEYAVLLRKDEVAGQEDIRIVIGKREVPLIVKKFERNKKFSIKTKICKDNASIYVNAPSREIRKWFESRRI